MHRVGHDQEVRSMAPIQQPAQPDPDDEVASISAKRVLVVDFDQPFACQLQRGLETHGWEVLVARDLSVPSTTTCANFVVDACPDGRPRLDLVRATRHCMPRARIVVATYYASLRLAVDAIKAGADDCLAKPVGVDEILHILVAGHEPAGDHRLNLPSLAHMEWDYIARVLVACQGNLSLAARTMGIQRSTLQRRLKKYPPSR
jgi:two-component system response regulator RegA